MPGIVANTKDQAPAAQDAFSKTISAITDFFGMCFNGIKAAFTSIFNFITGSASQANNTALENIDSAVGSASDTLSGLPDNVKQAMPATEEQPLLPPDEDLEQVCWLAGLRVSRHSHIHEDVHQVC